MNVSIGLVYDLIFLILLVGAALDGRRRGFVSGLVSLIGSVAGVVAGVYASRAWALPLYRDHLGVTIGETVAATLNDCGGDFNAALAKLEFLPDAARETLRTLVTNLTGEAVPQIVSALEPVFLPLIQTLLFLAVWILVRAVFRLIARWLRGINAIPLVGTLNKMLGLAFGVVAGLLNCWIFSLAVWMVSGLTGGRLEFLSSGALAHSRIYTLLSGFNPFLLHY